MPHHAPDHGAKPRITTGPAPDHQIIKPRSTGKMRPVTQAIQLALFRRDSDGVPRIVKFGEMIVREALKGNETMAKIVADRMDGRVFDASTSEENGAPVDFQTSLIAGLIEALVDKKLSAAGQTPGDRAKVIGSTVLDQVEALAKPKE